MANNWTRFSVFAVLSVLHFGLMPGCGLQYRRGEISAWQFKSDGEDVNLYIDVATRESVLNIDAPMGRGARRVHVGLNGPGEPAVVDGKECYYYKYPGAMRMFPYEGNAGGAYLSKDRKIITIKLYWESDPGRNRVDSIINGVYDLRK